MVRENRFLKIYEAIQMESKFSVKNLKPANFSQMFVWKSFFAHWKIVTEDGLLFIAC